MSLKEEAFEFLERCDGHKTLTALYADFSSLIAHHGFDYFVLTGIPEVGRRAETVILKTTYPEEWSRRYRDQRYELVDPIGRMTTQSVKPFTWSEAAQRFGQDRQGSTVMMEAAEMGLRDGFAVPMFDTKTFQAVVSLGADRRRDLPRVDQGLLTLASTYFKMAVDGLTDVEPAKVSTITPREREILSWSAVGKSRWEVSSILGIAEGTVRAHLAAIHTKLDVTTTTHAVTKAIRHRLITP